jgi:hypothetical protein
MPGFDGTGPRGQGLMTGGGFGFCSVPFASRGGWLPRGGAFGAGRGRGWRNRYWITGQPLWFRGAMPLPGRGYGLGTPVGGARMRYNRTRRYYDAWI